MAHTVLSNGRPRGELLLLVDLSTGALLLESPDHAPAELLADLEALAGAGAAVGCATPRSLLLPRVSTANATTPGPTVRITGYYHGSVVEGPGRRSSVLFAGCPLACAGCWVPHLHAAEAGAAVPVGRLAELVLDPTHSRDGVSLLGGEPFAQPDGLLALVIALRARGGGHILAYSGYTYERLRAMAADQPAIGAALEQIDLLVDGPYVEALAGSAGPWTGSGNQRVIDMVTTRRCGRIVHWEARRVQRQDPSGTRHGGHTGPGGRARPPGITTELL
ncbi:MAG: 4Fe-4S single cluster domain-containing protein [Chloroflexota bacterium]